jgi:L-rhamnose mutarotase
MPQSECIRIRLKPGMTDKFVEWAKQVPTRMEEVKASMTEQGVLEQSIFLERAADGDFIVLYWKVVDAERARAIFQNSKRKIDLEMVEMIEKTWDRSQVSRLEPLMEV